MNQNFIPLASPNISDEAIDKVGSVLRSGMLVQGKHVASLEADMSLYMGTSFCSAVTNGTSSLHLSLLGLNVGPGDEVIIPALSYVATANVVEHVGATPIFVDVKGDLTIEPSLIEDKISSKTKAIIPVHEFGLTADMDPIMKIAKSAGVKIIEDAACALGSKYKDLFCGSIGDYGSFSLHPRKAITSGEGGLVITNEQSLDERIKTLRNHGIKPGAMPLEFVDAGFNCRMTEFQAVLVLDQMKGLEDIISKRNRLSKIYFEELGNTECKLPIVPDYARTNWQTFHIVLDSQETRNSLKEYLLSNNIQSNYGAQCMPEMTFYKNKYGLDSLREFPNAFEAYTQGLAIPLYEKLDEEHIVYISKTILNFFNRNGK